MRIIIGLLFSVFFLSSGWAQQESWMYLRVKDTTYLPAIPGQTNASENTTEDPKVSRVLSRYTIHEFKKTQRLAKKPDLKRTFFVRANSDQLMTDLLREASHIFEAGELIPVKDRKIFEPNDYGFTSTIGDSQGLPVSLDYLDFLGLPEAWYYTTGSPEVKIGISDALVDTTNLDFKGKVKVFRNSSLSKGHGSAVAAIAAAQGDNKYGIPGLCYDCDIYATNYGDFKYFRQLKELSEAGSRVINCSWVGRTYYEDGQAAVDEMFKNGTILVAGSGNKSWQATSGDLKYYPASYDKVISVSSVMYKYEQPEDNINYQANGRPYLQNIRGYLGRTAGFVDHDINKAPKIYPVSTATLNEEVDLLAPTVGVFRYSKFVMENKIMYGTFEGTSVATPFVTGTIGLMLSLYPCLPTDEIESILKMTAINIDDIEVNKPYKGMYGAGIVHPGNAVKMVYGLYANNGTAYIKDQQFSRWDFKLTSAAQAVVMQDQKFTESATLDLTAKNQVVLRPGTILRPGSGGRVALRIDPSIEPECDLRLRDPSIESSTSGGQ